jgi:hypothetical protein
MHFINNENLVAAMGGEILDVVAQLADIVNTGIGAPSISKTSVEEPLVISMQSGQTLQGS